MEEIKNYILDTVRKLYGPQVQNLDIQETRKEFEGDLTLIVFPLLKYSKKNPENTAEEIAKSILLNEKITKYNVVSGFLNFSLDDSIFLDFLNNNYRNEEIGKRRVKEDEKGIMVEYSSPNTNKPLHLGHIRNNLLGYSISKILQASGKNVYTTQVINDRGIHICKSMIAWIKYAEGKEPKDLGLKGDKFVGNFYVKFDTEYKKEINKLIEKGFSEDEAKKKAPIMLEAQELLKKWEDNDEETIDLWKKMNSWVYRGFDETYRELGVYFDKNYYESDTYILGKNIVEKGLENKILYKKEDGSVWADLSDDGLDEKLLLRADGTSVYMTQDLGTALERFDDFDIDTIVYTVGNEQDYHFKVLFKILKKLGYSWADNMYHLSYGMVELPDGKMKSREGTVVDADDLINQMKETAKNTSEELQKLTEYSEEEKIEIYRKIGLGALKYFILKVEPKKKILFNPKESIDFNGNTGPFIQYTYVRIRSIFRKIENFDGESIYEGDLPERERNLIKSSLRYSEIICQSAREYNPSLVANYVYSLVREYNSFYQSTSILNSENYNEKILRLKISMMVSIIIKSCMELLGVDMPERM